MKKSIKILVLMVVLMIVMISNVMATSGATIAEDLYNTLSPYGMTMADKVRVERYQKSHTVTDEQASAIMEQANLVVAVFKEAGVTNARKLTKAQRNQVREYIIEAGSVVGLKVVFVSEDKANIYDSDGKLLEVYWLTADGKLAYTGNNINTILVVSSIVAIALAGTVVAIRTKKED